MPDGRFGEAGLKGGMGGFGGGRGAEGFTNPFDIFEQFFGGGGGGGFSSGFGGMGGMGGMRSRSQPGNDERYELVLDFKEAVFGCRCAAHPLCRGVVSPGLPGFPSSAVSPECSPCAVCSKELEVSRLEACGTCNGSGIKAGTSVTTCGTCGGSGQMVQPVRTPLGNFQQVIQCTDCDGTGERSTPCSTCAGDGRVRKSKRLAVTVPAGKEHASLVCDPAQQQGRRTSSARLKSRVAGSSAGVDSGSRLRIRSEGNAGRKGGPPGDLYVFISTKGHPKLKRDGTTIHADAEISYVDAILGCSVQVVFLSGCKQSFCRGPPPFPTEGRLRQPRLAIVTCVSVHAGPHSGWAGGPQDPCRNATGYHAADGEARGTQAGSRQEYEG